MREADSQYVIKIENIIQIDDKKCIMMEYANQGTLGEFISNFQNQKVSINANQILDLACDIFQGLNVLHSKKIIHRDIKMENLLVSNYQIKVADLGVATFLISKSYAQTNVGNILYAATEKLNEKYNSAADIFSAGLIIFQMVFGVQSSELLKVKINNNYQIYFEDSPLIFRKFLESLINQNPELRPEAIDAYNQCKAFKYDQEVLNFINSYANRINPCFTDTKSNQFFIPSSNQDKLLSTEADSKLYFVDEEEQIFQRGLNCLFSLNLTSAEVWFNMILARNPSSVKGLCGRLLCGYYCSEHINMKQYTNQWLQEQLNLIKQLNPSYYLYYYCLGIVNKDIYYIDVCLELNPIFAEAIALKGALHADYKEIQEGIKYGQQALQLSENNPFVLYQLGYIYLNVSLDISQKFFERCLLINQNYLAFYYLGIINYKQNNIDKALDYFNESLNLYPYHKNSIEQIIKIKLYELQQYYQVIFMIDRLFQELGEVDFLLQYLANSYQHTQNTTKSLLYYSKSLLYQENCYVLNNIGVIYQSQQEYEKAKVYFQKSIDKKYKPSYIDMFYLLNDQLNDQDQAYGYLQELLQLDFDDNSEVDCSYRISAHRLLGDYSRAIEYSQQYLNIHPSSNTICQEILNLISLEDFDFNLSEQYKISEQIQKNKGISYQTTICQLKYFCSIEMYDIVLTQIMSYLYHDINNQISLKITYRFPFQKYIQEYQVETLFQQMKQMCEDNPYNIHSKLYFLDLIFLTDVNFSKNMIEDLDQFYNNNIEFFSNQVDWYQIQYFVNQFLTEIQHIKYNNDQSQSQILRL
ncbi:hypothetical protein ABPG74_007781 [Tetrahymena malaccensis]